MTQKWNLQDIRPAQTQKRRIPEGARLESVQPRMIDEQVSTGDDDIRIPITNGTKQKNKSLVVALIVFFAVLGGGLAMSALMGGAEVTVYPRHKEPSVNAEFIAYKVADAGKLPFELMTLEAEGERQVKATGEEQVSTQAQGTIFIYNEAQKEPLRLVTNTRFESQEGLIFKIKDSVIVPGYTTSADGKKVRGVATAFVYADQVGANYNLGPSKFTVPGFKGEPEYTTIYAESTDTFTGGFNDKKFIIDEAELQTAEQALRTELRNSLLTRIDAEKPAKFTVFKDAVTFTYESLPSVAYGEGLATIKEKVLLRIPIFKEDDFAKNLAAAAIPGYTGEQVRIADTSALTFSYKGATTSSSDISNAEQIEFTLEGKPQIIWKYDAEKLKADLLNTNKNGLNVVLGGYPAIERATGVIRPFWKSKFPTKIDEIEVIEVIGESKSE
jgi:hypothetical protein